MRQSKGLTHADLFHRKVTTSGEYYRICRSKTGPSVKTLNSLIVGMGYNWHDWAAALEKAFSQLPAHLASETKHGRPKKNIPAVSNGE